MNKALSWTGVVALVLLACALVFVGLGISLRTQDSADPRDAVVPFDGFLIVTVGIGMAVAACRIAAKLGAARGVEGFLGVFLSFFGIPAFLSLIVAVWRQHNWPDGLPPAGLVWLALAVLETMAALVWLLAKSRRAPKKLDRIAS